MRFVIDCADDVPRLFEALDAGDQDEVVKIKERIYETEARADEIKNQLREHLPRGLFLPVDRRDLLEVLDMQDSIADVAQDIAGLLVERQMAIPPPLRDALLPYVSRCVDTCHQAASIISNLDELLELGFRGREAARVEELILNLNKIEDETDIMGLELSRQLFQHEETMNPISVMFWYRLIEWIGDLADYAEKVGNRLRLMIAH
jgi:predicted phosphate transport protein (TIGR00153 family)